MTPKLTTDRIVLRALKGNDIANSEQLFEQGVLDSVGINFYKDKYKKTKDENWLKAEGLRNQLLFRNRLEIEPKQSRIVITPEDKFILPDYGNIEFNFSPLRKAIYKLFLNSEKGYSFDEIPALEEKILMLYQKFPPERPIQELKEIVKKICEPFSSRLHEEVSKINTEIVKKLGERVSADYIISGERGGKRKIKYDYIAN